MISTRADMIISYSLWITKIYKINISVLYESSSSRFFFPYDPDESLIFFCVDIFQYHDLFSALHTENLHNEIFNSEVWSILLFDFTRVN